MLQVRQHLSKEGRNCSLLGKMPALICCKHEELGSAEPDACRARALPHQPRLPQFPMLFGAGGSIALAPGDGEKMAE